MIAFDEKYLPWDLSRKLREIIGYFQCDMMHFCFVSEKKVTLIPIPIRHVEHYSNLFLDKNYYKHPSLYPESYKMIPGVMSELDKFLLRIPQDRVWGQDLIDHKVYGLGGNGITISKCISRNTYICLALTYDKGYMIQQVLKDRKLSLKYLEDVAAMISQNGSLWEKFSFLRADFNYVMAALDQKALKVIQMQHPELSLKQYHFAKYLSQADDLSSKSIARGLGLSVRTVDDYFTFLKDKLGTKDRISTILRCYDYFMQYWAI
ncbi:hypothetical protein L3V82_06365 [Thiotrichales bacterium 19S3-7]|nr:hypothetical protein [Thiotrichales bacterium 19S3-7]MCF6801720.1 hypothetical protein [Thiotrichales bacterium 19S3-11]